MSVPNLKDLPEESVIVAVSHCAVHWVDCLMVAGQYQQAPPLPYTPGMEYSGTVLNPGRSNLQIGDKVMVDGLLSGPRSYGSFQA